MFVKVAGGEGTLLLEWRKVLVKWYGAKRGALETAKMYQYLSRFGYCLTHLQN